MYKVPLKYSFSKITDHCMIVQGVSILIYQEKGFLKGDFRWSPDVQDESIPLFQDKKGFLKVDHR